ncbi:MAG: hypothetical protein GWO86_01730 [Planctomycetes bacterium]|nr:hypothetical protein [Planctomycetota bacterium]
MLILSAAAADTPAVNPQVTLQVTGSVSGNIVLELYPDKAPVTVGNFIDYVRSGFYDGLIFHRVIENFMIQGGGYDPNMVRKTPGEAIINESSNGLSNLAGTIAMARTPDPHSATSEFFINHVDNLGLDYGTIAYNGQEAYYKVGYCVFGRVISGMSVVNAIAALPTTNDRPDEDVIIQSAAVTLQVPFCTEKLPGDIDSDCDVDTVDLLKFAIQWLNPECQGCYSADISGDGEVDFSDFVKMTANWLNCNSITTPCD